VSNLHPIFQSIVEAHGLTPNSYRGWTISFEYGEFVGVGPNYDASYEGPEDGWVDNGERCFGLTLENLHAEIDAYIDETQTDSLRSSERKDISGNGQQISGDAS
jgi:hypothetical protein